MTIHHPAYKAAHQKVSDAPDVTIKWRENEPPYVEVRSDDELILAGWVHSFPDAMPLLDPAVDDIDGTFL